jgi:hypothetical protein
MALIELATEFRVMAEHGMGFVFKVLRVPPKMISTLKK